MDTAAVGFVALAAQVLRASAVPYQCLSSAISGPAGWGTALCGMLWPLTSIGTALSLGVAGALSLAAWRWSRRLTALCRYNQDEQ